MMEFCHSFISFYSINIYFLVQEWHTVSKQDTVNLIINLVVFFINDICHTFLFFPEVIDILQVSIADVIQHTLRYEMAHKFLRNKTFLLSDRPIES